MSAAVARFSPRRVGVIARATLTQLVRMKILWFLAVAALIIAVLGVLASSLSISPVQQLDSLKGSSLFVMGMFAALLAIASTAILIPRDIEDRTLYTILCRPVPRIEYLLGKYLGILALLAGALLAMDAILSLILWLRQGRVIGEQLALYAGMGLAPDELAREGARLAGHGLTWSLQGAVATAFLRAAIMAALTLLLSTMATSTLFTQVTAVSAYLIGHLVAIARSEALTGDGWLLRTLVGGAALVFPDMQLFNLDDAVVGGGAIPAAELLRLGGTGLVYILVYLGLAWLVFAEREY